DFSNLIFVDGGGFLVAANAPINRFTDLNGKKVAVIKGTTTEKRLAEAMKSHLVNAQIRTISDGSEGVALLTSGAVGAFAGDTVKLIGLAAPAKDPDQFGLPMDD